MPTYVYLCDRCGSKTSESFKMTEYPQTIPCRICADHPAEIIPSWQGPYGIGGDNSASTPPKGKGTVGK